VTAADLRASGAMLAILRDAVKPNLVQTLEHTPVLVHTGPFGNIAHGNSSVLADLIGIRTGDFLITEAGFGADMGAERFFDIKCPTSGLRPDAAVVVATVRALKVHSGHYRVIAGRPLPDALLRENPDDVRAGAANLRKQIENIEQFGVPAVVAINAFPTDHPSEWQAIAEAAESLGVRVAVSHHFAHGGRGAAELAEAVADACTQPTAYAPLYSAQAPLSQKIETIARHVYGADGVDYAPTASAELERYERLGWGHLPVCIAKTHLSISSDALLCGAPRGWRLPVREVRAAVGAGYVYVICGDTQTMPGLGAHPAMETIDLDAEGNVVGLTQSHAAP
jgi:formate--tetrahydrofolate ligase